MLSIFAEMMSRMRNDVRWISGTGVPVDGTTGAGDAGKGSLYTNVSTGKIYVNNGTKASPAWGIVTSA